MKLFPFAASAVLMFAITTPATAQQAADEPKQEKKVCRAQGASTGSILNRKRVCHTKAEWAAIDQTNARNTERSIEARRANSTIGR